MSLAEATEAYQAQLESSRRAWTDMSLPLDEIELLDEDLAKAKRAMEIAWLEHTTGMPVTSTGHAGEEASS